MVSIAKRSPTKAAVDLLSVADQPDGHEAYVGGPYQVWVTVSALKEQYALSWGLFFHKNIRLDFTRSLYRVNLTIWSHDKVDCPLKTT